MTSAEEKKRIGIFGGTFDPVHLGHLRAAEEVRRILGLEKVVFVPSAIPPHKNPIETTNQADRLNMLELATQPYRYFEISTYELDKEGTSYTIDTLRHFSTQEPDTEFYFIVGSELFSTIDSWKDYSELFKYANFAVLGRPGFKEDESSPLPLAIKADFRYYKQRNDVKIYENKHSKKVVLTHIEGIKVSSTEIRTILRAGKPINDLVSAEVESYIIENGLYLEDAS